MHMYRIWPFLSFKSLTFENKTLTEVSPFQRLCLWIINTAGDLEAQKPHNAINSLNPVNSVNHVDSVRHVNCVNSLNGVNSAL